MDSKYQGIFRRDTILLGAFTFFMWIVMLFVFSQIIGVAPGMTAKLIVAGSGLILVTFATSAMVAVYMHLRRNGAQLYEEELACHDAGN